MTVVGEFVVNSSIFHTSVQAHPPLVCTCVALPTCSMAITMSSLHEEVNTSPRASAARPLTSMATSACQRWKCGMCGMTCEKGKCGMSCERGCQCVFK